MLSALHNVKGREQAFKIYDKMCWQHHRDSFYVVQAVHINQNTGSRLGLAIHYVN